ncbi:ABC-type multidrug transport system, ATPase and permease component [Sinosporangium album]|uniref:ABC-type multidrug transport system, ATPase and permease component n=1 Tax=Sinosporangium album TaxID=504805 RepID=A0A1G8HN36_9ACTN|nr:ABC transporter ATP-binding protein [Sinosporangium album]SDI07891.1 ABC-type multidrug transport system, ATPase and permease component [Sinosporangium album]
MAEVQLLSDEPAQRGVLRAAWPHLRPHRRRVASALVFSLAESAALVAIAPVIATAVQALVDGDRDRFLAAVAALMGVVVAQAVLARVGAVLLARAGEHVVRDLREQVVERLAGAPLRFLEAHRGGSLLQRATGEVAELAQFVRDSLPALIGVLSTLGFTAVVMAGYSVPLTLVVVAVFLPPAVLITRSFAKHAGPAFAAQAGAEATMAGTFAETLDIKDALRSTGGLPAWMTRFERDNVAALDAQRRAVHAENRIVGITFVEGFTMAVLLVLGAWLVADGRLDVGGIVVFVLAGRNLFEGFGELSQLAGDAQTARTGLARLLDLLDRTSADGGTGTLPERGELTATGVTYAYENGADVLHRVTVTFAPGDHAGLVGESGSGKTTLSKLLSGLYTPDAGTVTYGGVDLRDIPTAELRRRVVLVPQDVHVVAGSVLDNLALAPGSPGGTEIEAAVAALGIGDFVAALPGGLSTPAGDLSAGERQILGLIRAVLVDPAVLILDEATADVDPDTGRRLETAVAALRRGRTLIVIAHRRTTIELLPRLVTLRAGRLA